MYCLFNFTMATYYNFEIWDSCEMESSDKRLYEDFDELCDVADEILTKRNGKFIKPNRKAIKEKLKSCPAYAVWYTHQENETSYGTRIYINQMKVVPKKQKYVYRYSVLCTPTPNRHSQLYDSFDEMYDAANKELTELYKTIGKDWADPETQSESRKNWRWDTTKEGCRKTLEENNSVQYAYFIDPNGGFKTDTLVVNGGVRTDRFYLDKVAV